MLLTKPKHNRYALHGLPNSTYIKYAEAYSSCKCYGVRGIYAFLSGSGLWGVVKEVAQGNIVQYGKRRLATIVVGGAAYLSAPAVAVITNSTKVVKCCKVIFVTVGYAMEAMEDASQVTFLPLDLVLFGQPIPANKKGRFSSWGNITNVVDNLSGIDS